MTDDERDDDDDFDDYDPDRACHTCCGEGIVVLGEDVPLRDIDIGRGGEIEKCPNCNGSGDAKDCRYW